MYKSRKHAARTAAPKAPVKKGMPTKEFLRYLETNVRRLEIKEKITDDKAELAEIRKQKQAKQKQLAMFRKWFGDGIERATADRNFCEESE